MISASALPRLFKCLASGVHPQAEYRTKWADQGTERHAEQEDAINAGDLSKLPDEVRALVEGMEVRSEVGLAYDVATDKGRVLGYGLKREYVDLGAYEIPGTSDLVAVAPGRVVLADFKGWEDVGHPSKNEQTLHNALALSRIYKVDEVTVCIAHIVEGRPRVYVHTLDVFDLDAFVVALRQLQKDALVASGNPSAYEVEGSHCKYCNAFAACSLKRGLALEIRSGTADMRLAEIASLDSDEDAARAYEFLQRAKMLTARLSAMVYARGAQKPFPIGDGKFFGKHATAGQTKLDADITYEVVREKHGQGIADAAVTRKASQAGIKRALELVGAKGEVAKLSADVLAEVKKRGGAKKEPGETIDEFVPQLRAVND